jgi:spore coat protein U-like protein
MVGDTYQHELSTPKLDFKQRICLQLTGVSPMFLKSKFSKTAIASAFAVAAMVSAQSANAQSTTAPLLVSAQVVTACSFDVASYTLPFQTIVIGTGIQDKEATVDVSVTCGSAQAYSIGASGTVGARSMTGSGTAQGGFLNYELYRDSIRTLALGDAFNSNRITGSGTSGTHTIYGRIPQSTNTGALAGAYADTIQLTLYF